MLLPVQRRGTSWIQIFELSVLITCLCASVLIAFAQVEELTASYSALEAALWHPHKKEQSENQALRAPTTFPS